MKNSKSILSFGEKILSEKSAVRRSMKMVAEFDMLIKAVSSINDSPVRNFIDDQISQKGFACQAVFNDTDRIYEIVLAWVDRMRKEYPILEKLYDDKDAIIAQCTWSSTQRIGYGTVNFKVDKYTYLKIKSYQFEDDEKWGKDKRKGLLIRFTGANAKILYTKFMRELSYEYKRLYDKLYIYSSSGATIVTDKHKPESMVQPEFWLIKGFIDKLITEESKSVFEKMDQVFKSSFLLYGEPGTGKTRSIITLASLFNARVVRVNLKDNNWKFHLDNIDFYYSHYGVMTFVIIEDIDMYIPNTNRDDEVDKKEVKEEDMKVGKKGKGGVRPAPMKNDADKTSLLGDLFQYMDGTDSQSGAIYFLTTNHIEKLDKGLLRCGRLDYKVEYLYLDREHQDMLIKNAGLTREELNDDTIPELTSPATLTVYLRSRALGIENWKYADYEKSINNEDRD